MAIFASCEEFGGNNQLIIDPVEDALLEQTVGSETITAEGVSFTTTGAWTSQVVPVSTKASQPMWVSITPDHGDEAGTYTISINLEANDTGEDRTANIIITCGSQTITITITQVATEDVPSQGEVQTPEYKKYVSKLEWNYTHYEGGVEKDVLTFEYDDINRITRMCRNYTDLMYEENEQNVWTFDYSVADKVELSMSVDGTLSYTYEATLDKSGRVSRSVVKGDDGGYLRYEYDNDGYLSAYAIGELDEDGAVEGGIKYIYTDGLLSAAQYFSNDGGYKEAEPDEIPYFNAMYINRYKNDKINVDLNAFLLEGEFQVEEELIWLPVRMCGKFTDCLMEIGGLYDGPIPVDHLSGFTTPNVTIPMKYTTVRTEVPETGNPIVWTFDADGCPLTATETFNYQEYEVTYDIVVGDTVIGQRPDWDPETDTEVMVNFYDHTTTEKQYTPTENKWSCPQVLTVTYRE